MRRLLPLLLLALAGCNALREDFLGKRPKRDVFDAPAVYAQSFGGTAAADFTWAHTVEFAPDHVDVAWDYDDADGCHPVAIVLRTAPPPLPSYVPYAVVTIDGRAVTVQILNTRNLPGCWSITTTPAKP